MAIKSENTMAEGLQAMMQDIAKLKLTPDADLRFIVEELETPIISYLQGQMAQGVNQGNIPQGAGMPPGGMPGMQPGMGPGLPAGPMGGRGAVNAPMGPPMSPGAPPMDELQRLLS